MWAAAPRCVDTSLTVHPQTFVAGTILFTNSVSLAATNLAYEWNNVAVSNCTLTLNGLHHFNSLTVVSNTTVAHPPCTATESFSLWLMVGDGLVIDSTSKIDASGRGYLAGRTSGNATKGAATGRSGGSYGGLGHSGSPSWVYGDFRNPREPGSGGGPDLGNAAGGGLIRITANSLIMDGLIIADGRSGFDSWNRAGGSGGGIRINVNSLSGSGAIPGQMSLPNPHINCQSKPMLWNRAGASGGGILISAGRLQEKGMIAANGGNGSIDGGGGGGGRVAIYVWETSGRLALDSARRWEIGLQSLPVALRGRT